MFAALACLLLCVIRPAYSTAAVGATCTNTASCLADGYCGTDLKCACRAAFTGAAAAANCTAVAITNGVCTSTGGQCGNLANAYCNAANCVCGAAFIVNGSLCEGKACTATTVCGDADANSECDTANSTNKCKCKANYGMLKRGSQAKCQLGVGGTCTATGNQCANLPGGYCNTAVASPVCACGLIYTASTVHCDLRTCDKGSTTCETIDSGSECVAGWCACKSGMSIGTAGKCVTSAGMPGAVLSMVMLMGCLLFAKIN